MKLVYVADVVNNPQDFLKQLMEMVTEKDNKIRELEAARTTLFSTLVTVMLRFSADKPVVISEQEALHADHKGYTISIERGVQDEYMRIYVKKREERGGA